MSMHDAGYSPQRGQAWGVPERSPLFTPAGRHVVNEPRRLEQLPWPGNLFGEPMLIAELLAEAAQLPELAAGNGVRPDVRGNHQHNVRLT